MTEQRTVEKSFGEVAKGMLEGAPKLTAEEEAAVDAEAEEEGLGGTPSPLERKAASPGDEVALPAWVRVPAGLVIPPWKQVGYVRFKVDLTDRPDLGERMIVTWGLSVPDERLAKQASRGDGTRTYEEMAKRTIRAIDGVKVDWSGKRGGKGDVGKFWEEIGPKARMLVINLYLQTHTPQAEETADFFLDCCTYRTSVVG